MICTSCVLPNLPWTTWQVKEVQVTRFVKHQISYEIQTSLANCFIGIISVELAVSTYSNCFLRNPNSSSADNLSSVRCNSIIMRGSAKSWPHSTIESSSYQLSQLYHAKEAEQQRVPITTFVNHEGPSLGHEVISSSGVR